MRIIIWRAVLGVVAGLLLLTSPVRAQEAALVQPLKGAPITVFSAVTGTRTSSAYDRSSFAAIYISGSTSGTCTASTDRVDVYSTATSTGTFVRAVVDGNQIDLADLSNGFEVYTGESFVQFLVTDADSSCTYTITATGLPIPGKVQAVGPYHINNTPLAQGVTSAAFPVIVGGLTGAATTDTVEALKTTSTGALVIGSAPTAGTVDTQNEDKTTDVTLEAATTNLRLLGWTVREDAGTPAVATVLIRHGVEAAGSCTGNVIAYVELAASTSTREWYGDRGLAVASGVCADITAGEIDINIYTVTEAAP